MSPQTQFINIRPGSERFETDFGSIRNLPGFSSTKAPKTSSLIFKSTQDFYEKLTGSDFSFPESIGQQFIPILEQELIDASVLEAISNSDHEIVKMQALKVVGNISEVISLFDNLGVDVEGLPPLRGYNPKDGSILLEWDSPDFRIGFSLEPDEKESSWYLVSPKNLGGISASGFISPGKFSLLVCWLLYFCFLEI